MVPNQIASQLNQSFPSYNQIPQLNQFAPPFNQFQNQSNQFTPMNQAILPVPPLSYSSQLNNSHTLIPQTPYPAPQQQKSSMEEMFSQLLSNQRIEQRLNSLESE